VLKYWEPHRTPGSSEHSCVCVCAFVCVILSHYVSKWKLYIKQNECVDTCWSQNGCFPSASRNKKTTQWLSDAGPWSYYESHKWLWYGHPYSVPGIGQDYSIRHQTREFLGPLNFLASFTVAQTYWVKWRIHFLLRHKLRKEKNFISGHIRHSAVVLMGTEEKNLYLLKLSCTCTPNPRFPRVRNTRCRPNNKNKTLKPFSECKKVKVKCSRYRPGVAQRVGRGIALLFHDRGTRGGWVVSSTPPHLPPGKTQYPLYRRLGGPQGRSGRGGGEISSSPGFDPGPSSP